MASLDIVTIILLGLVGILFCLASYLYGRQRGAKEALSKPELTHPSIREVTILGRFGLPTLTSEQIRDSLSEWLHIKGYVVSSFPNLIEIRLVRDPPQAATKKNYFDRLLVTRDGLPAQLTLNMRPSVTEAYMEIDTICLPIMHRKMGQEVQQIFPKA